MYSVRQRGDDLAQSVRDAHADGRLATQDAVRRGAMAARKELRRLIRLRFGSEGRVFNARGFAAAIKVNRKDPTWWQVVDRSVYKKKRTQSVSLAWVFDTAPIIRGRKGWMAVPIKDKAPLANSGRRYAWPSEAARMGWELEVATVMGKPFKVIFGRRSRREEWQALYYYIPPYKAGKRLDLDAVLRKYGGALDGYWAEAFDRRTSRRGVRRIG